MGTTTILPRPEMNQRAKGSDYRFPLYLADWKRSTGDRFARDDLDEPHIKRKVLIQSRHPEIAALFGPETQTIPLAFLLVSVQLSLAYYLNYHSNSIILFAVLVYVVGASITQMLGTVIHEACHNLCHENYLVNRMVGFMANICIPFPIAASFRRYHLEHHAYQGVLGKDPDLPLEWEYKFIKGGSPLRKALFLFFYPLMYVVRGLAQQRQPTAWEIYNVIFTICTDIMVWNICGPKGFFYIFCSLWFGYGIHPGAAHFVQEHFTWNDGQETYSYYGALNYIFLNIGYHNEHHDFTRVPWTKIKEVRKMAPEFYDTLHFHNSWWMVLYEFIFDPELGPHARLDRTMEAHKAGRKLPIPGINEDNEKFQRVDSGFSPVSSPTMKKMD